MEVFGFQTPYLQSNTYLLVENQHGIIVDPAELDAVKNVIEKRKLVVDYAILTHEHWDHIVGTDWTKSLGAKVLCSQICANNIKDAKKNGSHYANAFNEAGARIKNDSDVHIADFVCMADKTFMEAFMLDWQRHSLQLRETPGHSQGSSCVLVDKDILFSGDSCFASMSVNTRFWGGNQHLYQQNTEPYLRGLSPDIRVYPGHFSSFILGDWQQANTD